MKVEVERRKDLLATRAAEAVNELLNTNKDKPILFLTSGGSSFDLLDHTQIPQVSHISLGVLDERFSDNPTENNFSQLKSTPFFKRSEVLFEHVLDTTVLSGETLEEFTQRYEFLLTSWMIENPNGVIVATIGMGPDGHISGMMPFPENKLEFERLFNDSGRLVVGYDVGDKNPYRKRATTTMEFMRRISYGVTYITGENKREAFGRLMADEGSLAETPARILRDMPSIQIFTDLG